MHKPPHTKAFFAMRSDPCRLYSPSTTGMQAMRDAKAIFTGFLHFAQVEEDGFLKLWGQRGFVRVIQDGNLFTCTTHEFAVSNFVIFTLFISAFLLLGTRFTDPFLLKQHLELTDKYIMCVPHEFMKLFSLHPTCRAPGIMRKYIDDEDKAAIDADVSQSMFFWDVIQRMRHRKQLHPSLLTLYGPLEQKYYCLAFFSHKLMEYLQELYDSTGSGADFVEFLNENCLNSVKLYRECDHIQDDIGCFQTEDGTKVYNFKDPDCYHKWMIERKSKVHTVYASLPDLQSTEPKQQDRIPRKVLKVGLNMDLTLRSHRVGCVDRSLFSKIKDCVIDHDCKQIISSFNARYLKMHNEVWQYRDKCHALLIEFFDANLLASSYHDGVMHRIQETALIEFKSVVHAILGACRLLKAVRLPVV